jgi:hypothetical protein
LKKVRLCSGSGSLRNLSIAAAWTPCASINKRADNTCINTSQLYLSDSFTDIVRIVGQGYGFNKSERPNQIDQIGWTKYPRKISR